MLSYAGTIRFRFKGYFSARRSAFYILRLPPGTPSTRNRTVSYILAVCKRAATGDGLPGWAKQLTLLGLVFGVGHE